MVLQLGTCYPVSPTWRSNLAYGALCLAVPRSWSSGAAGYERRGKPAGRSSRRCCSPCRPSRGRTTVVPTPVRTMDVPTSKYLAIVLFLFICYSAASPTPSTCPKRALSFNSSLAHTLLLRAEAVSGRTLATRAQAALGLRQQRANHPSCPRKDAAHLTHAPLASRTQGSPARRHEREQQQIYIRRAHADSISMVSIRGAPHTILLVCRSVEYK